MQELLPGESVRFSEPPDAGAGYKDFTRQQYQGVAAGTGLPYELLTGDLAGVSDRALRVILNEFRRHCQQRQWHILIPQFCRRVRAAWADAAVIAGILTGDEGREAKRVTWVPQGWAYIHPTQDVQAQQIAVESGFTSRSRVITERGDDPEEIDRERAADEDREDALELGDDSPDIEPQEDDALAAAMLEGQRSLGNAIAQLAAREQPAPQLTVQLPPPGKPTMKVGRRLADGSVEIREIEIGAGDAD
jgi:lambda family phage portal protein